MNLPGSYCSFKVSDFNNGAVVWSIQRSLYLTTSHKRLTRMSDVGYPFCCLKLAFAFGSYRFFFTWILSALGIQKFMTLKNRVWQYAEILSIPCHFLSVSQRLSCKESLLLQSMWHESVLFFGVWMFCFIVFSAILKHPNQHPSVPEQHGFLSYMIDNSKIIMATTIIIIITRCVCMVSHVLISQSTPPISISLLHELALLFIPTAQSLWLFILGNQAMLVKRSTSQMVTGWFFPSASLDTYKTPVEDQIEAKQPEDFW